MTLNDYDQKDKKDILKYLDKKKKISCNRISLI